LVCLIAGLVFKPFLRQTQFKRLSGKYYFLILATAVCGAAIAPVLFFLGLTQTTAADTSLLANGETVFSILFATLIFRERLRPIGYIAVCVILFGVFIVTTNLEFDNSMFALDSGNLLIIGATMLWGFDNNICLIITKQIEVSRLVQIRSLVGGSILFLTVFVFRLPFNIQWTQIPSVVILGVFGFALSLFLYWHSIKRIGVVKASSIVSLSAAFGLVLAAIFLKEIISLYQVIAVAIMLLGIRLMYSREKIVEISY